MMATPPLVSILTPCYNGEATIGRLIESVLAQTYSDIEFVVVDDGSTDGTADAIMRYERDLKWGLRRFELVRQANRGLGGAIDTGLKHVTGEYLGWPDADDFLEPQSVSHRLRALQSMPDVAVVTSDAYMRPAADLGAVVGRVATSFAHNDDPWQFEHLLRAESIFTSGCHLACMRRFDETHPGRIIHPARRGQNWQMLLPLYHRYRRFYLDEPLYNYVVSPDSMSRSDDSLEKTLARADEHREIVRRTLLAMDLTAGERQRYESIMEELRQRRRLRAAREFGSVQVAGQSVRALRRAGRATPRDLAIFASAVVQAPFRRSSRGDASSPQKEESTT